MKPLNMISKTLVVTVAASLLAGPVYADSNSKRPGSSSSSSGSSSAAPAKKKKGSDVVSQNPMPPSGPDEVDLDPTYLRERVLRSNLSLEVELNTVKDQKTTVNLDRARLLPSLNLNIGSGGISNFMVSAVEFLFPFLMPSNWFQLDAQENVFNAEKISYKVLELNTYASALSMYYAILADNKSAQVYQQQADDLMRIYNALDQANDALSGSVSPEDLENALANANIAKATASNAYELTLQEIAAIRQVLSLPERTKINLKDHMEPALDIESQNVQTVVQEALDAAPEYEQINDLIKAAQAGVWNASFAWMTGGSATATPTIGGSTPNFGNMTGQLTFHFGADLFPSIELSQRNVTEIRLRLTALQQEVSQTVEAALLSTAQAAQQYKLAKDAESQLTDVYNITSQKYEFGTGTSIVAVLQAHANLTTASVTRVRAEQDLNNQRVTLERSLLLSQFSQIKGCDIDRKKPGFLSGIFGGTNVQIDQACREGGNNLKNK